MLCILPSKPNRCHDGVKQPTLCVNADTMFVTPCNYFIAINCMTQNWIMQPLCNCGKELLCFNIIIIIINLFVLITMCTAG